MEPNLQGFCIAVRDCEMAVYQNLTSRLPDRNAEENIRMFRCSEIGVQIDRNTRVCCPTPQLKRIFDRIAQDTLPNQGRCDLPMTNYIENGALAHIYEFPWSVKIAYQDITRNYTTELSLSNCAGTIITKNHILTAGKIANNF